MLQTANVALAPPGFTLEHKHFAKFQNLSALASTKSHELFFARVGAKLKFSKKIVVFIIILSLGPSNRAINNQTSIVYNYSDFMILTLHIVGHDITKPIYR